MSVVKFGSQARPARAPHSKLPAEYYSRFSMRILPWSRVKCAPGDIRILLGCGRGASDELLARFRSTFVPRAAPPRLLMRLDQAISRSERNP